MTGHPAGDLPGVGAATLLALFIIAGLIGDRTARHSPIELRPWTIMVLLAVIVAAYYSVLH